MAILTANVGQFCSNGTKRDKQNTRLCDKMMDLDKPVIVRMGGKEVFNGKVTRSAEVFKKTLYERNDPNFAFSAEITVSSK